VIIVFLSVIPVYVASRLTGEASIVGNR